MKNLLKKLMDCEGKRIIVIGDIMLDEYVHGSVNRISPEAPVPIFSYEKTEVCLGGAANVAANCKHIGLDVIVIGVIGTDTLYAQQVSDLCRKQQITTDGIVVSAERYTTVKKRFVSENHHVFRVDMEHIKPLSNKEQELLIQKIEKFWSPNSVVLVSDYAKGVVTKDLISYLVNKAKNDNVCIIVDPKGPLFDKYYGVDYIKPNLHEFNQLVNAYEISSQLSLQDKARALCVLLQLKALIITLGDKGIAYVTEKEYIHSPAYIKEVYDLTGAGDTVVAFLAVGFMSHIAIEDCLMLANKAASIAVSHFKTHAVGLQDLLYFAGDYAKKIIYDIASLKIELDWLRIEGKRIIFTNGCFDILHQGHVHLLQEAKRYGDILVVGLNSDASIQRLKGPSRPINPFVSRATVIAGLGIVDFVIAFDQDTPLNLIKYVQPDILIKGGDYVTKDIVGYDFVNSYGGIVRTIDLVDGFSTTACIKKIESQKII